MGGQDETRARAVLIAMQERLAIGPYVALGIDSAATPSQIRTAFLELTKTYHPARFGYMSAELQRLANEVFLSLRAAHDAVARPARAAAAKLDRSGSFPGVVKSDRSGVFPGAVRSDRSGSFPAVVPRSSDRSGSFPAVVPRNGDRSGDRNGDQSGAVPAVVPRSSDRSGAVPAVVPRSSDRSGAVPAVTPRGAQGGDRAGGGPPQAGRTTSPMGVPTTGRTTSPMGVPATGRMTPPMGVPIGAMRPPAPPPPPTTPAGGRPPAGPTAAPAAAPRLAASEDRELASALEQLQRGQWAAARATLSSLAARAPGVARYRALLSYARGREAQIAQRLDEARVELQAALQIDPDLQLAKTALAELFTRRK